MPQGAWPRRPARRRRSAAGASGARSAAWSSLHNFTCRPWRRNRPAPCSCARGLPQQTTETDMTTIKTMMAALLAGSLAVTAGGLAYAKADGGLAFDPAQMQQRLEKRVDRALTGTDATAEQKKKVADILGATFKDMKPLHDKRAENMKISDESSKRFTKALTDAGNVLTVQQRQAFFKSWSERQHHGRRG